MLLLIISLAAGVLTILAPCVLPLLPVIIGGAVTGEAANKARPYLIAGALAVSIIIFTLALKVSTILVGLSPSVLTWLSGGLLVALGAIMAAPEAWEKLMLILNLQAASDRLLDRTGHTRGRLLGPILIGVALGPVFTSCSPTYAFILASVLPRSFASGLVYLAAYTAGLVAALLAAALVGRRLTVHLGWAVNTHSVFRRLFGVLVIIVGLAVITGREVGAEVWIANHLPFDEAKIEQALLSGQTGSTLMSKPTTASSVLNVEPTPAPAFAGLTNWINSPPLTLASLHGHVVLVDFWTYSCINCLRTLPYVEKWYATYHNQGLVIIGVSTPEFAFEHDPANVAAAVKKDGILYPVALDNNYDTWNAFNNDSWPADYLIDKSGDIRYVSLGEGDYPTTEKAIQELLGVNQALTTPTSDVPIGQDQTPETYFGTNRDSDFMGNPGLANGTATYKPQANLGLNDWTLSGSWQVAGQSITSTSANSKLTFNVSAKDVYMVAGSANNQPAVLTVGLPAASSGDFGSDAPGGHAAITGSRLYHIVSLPQAGTTTVTLTVPAGVSLYTFTFGS
jgi:cytochrome c biogenesis protein CcdA/thiol-disulfide isomerase/thioredoxin